MKKLIWSAVAALVAFALCIFLPVAALENLWRITEAMDASEVTQVIAQLAEAELTPGYVPAAVCAAAVFAIAYLLSRHKIIAGILIFFVLLAGLVCALLAVRSSNVTVYTIVQIIVDYFRLGAF